MANKILIVDDEPEMRKSLANLLRREKYEIAEAAGGTEALDCLASAVFDLVVTDLMMEPMSGLDLLKQVKQTYPDLEVIVVSGAGTIEAAVDAMKLKAFDFITKPFKIDEILLRVHNALEKSRLKDEVRHLRREIEQEYGHNGMIGRSKPMQELFGVLRSIAETDVTVLIQGETGTGKELIARAIHYNGRRKMNRFVAVNCGAFSETLLESELFGHEKGAFTGATNQRKGIFESADGGTLFLDEIGETSAGTQVKLLRILEEGELHRVGGSDAIKVDVRILTATNRNLEELIKNGRFRQDLYYRLNVFPVTLAPLRERREDIPLLVTHFIEKVKARTKKEIKGVTPQAMAVLMACSWPGNVRELENVIQRMMVVAKGEVLDLPDLPPEMRGEKAASKAEPKRLQEMARESSELIEKRAIVDALAKTGGNVTRAAKALHISRATLQSRMKAYGLRNAKEQDDR